MYRNSLLLTSLGVPYKHVHIYYLSYLRRVNQEKLTYSELPDEVWEQAVFQTWQALWKIITWLCETRGEKGVKECNNVIVQSNHMVNTLARMKTRHSLIGKPVNSACCRCNNKGSCARCSHVKAGRPCMHCLPFRRAHCGNIVASDLAAATVIAWSPALVDPGPFLWNGTVQSCSVTTLAAQTSSDSTGFQPSNEMLPIFDGAVLETGLLISSQASEDLIFSQNLPFFVSSADACFSWGNIMRMSSLNWLIKPKQIIRWLNCTAWW